jgi:putative two-component system response regulator
MVARDLVSVAPGKSGTARATRAPWPAPTFRFAARIMATCGRVRRAHQRNKVYKDGVPHDKAVQIIFSERGGPFRPGHGGRVHRNSGHDLPRLHSRYADTNDDMQRKIEYMANAIAEIAEL